MEERMTLDECFAMLGRDPDVDAPELFAYDAADQLLLETAAPHFAALSPDELVVIGDRHGALTLGAAQVYGQRGIRTHQDPVLGERALARNAERLGLDTDDVYRSLPLDAALLTGARLVLVQLPRALDALDEIAAWIAKTADPGVIVLAGGRDKHMSRSMNDILARYFGEVSAGRGVRKARVLTATQPLASAAGATLAFPKWGRDRELSFELAAFGATFGGPTFDHGSRLMLAGLRAEHAGRAGDRSAPRRIVDLGCGNGVLAVSAALLFPEAEIIATDQSHAAVAATRLTAERAGVADRITVHRADGMEAVADGWADLVLLNPPFHTGAIVHAEVAHRLIKSCARVLAPGGELRIVFNSHMRYRPLVERHIGTTRQVDRDKTFTVLSSIRAQ
ncbi:methyltransferase [Leucobacter sp. CX42]|uniref:class I SAM-dependent methyltransferase n=1 Tax=unclassified Leucobacter TaxID=2621730 RepID=UPI00334055C6